MIRNDDNRAWRLVGIDGAYYPETSYDEQDGTAMTPRSHWMTTTDAGATWSKRENPKDMLFFLHGTYTTQGDPQWP